MSASGTKREAARSWEGGADGRPAEKLSRRFQEYEATQVSEAAGADTGADTSTAFIDIDLICTIASFMNTGAGLADLCVSVGPAEAVKIRTEYLRDNDFFVAASLRKLASIPDLNGDWRKFIDNIHLFDKCRDNILAWMAVNTNWQERCTDENMKRYKGSPIRSGIETNLVFNNPAVAIEIGLLEVLRFLVEEKSIDINRKAWSSFVCDDNGLLVRLAVGRGDTDILEFLLSLDQFDFARMSEEDGEGEGLEYNLIKFSNQDYFQEQCFKALVCNPKVNVNAVGPFGTTPLWWSLAELSRLCHYEFRDEAGLDRQMRLILLLLEAGANPCDTVPLQGPLIEMASQMLDAYPTNHRWRAVVEKMEEIVESMRRE